MNRGESAISAGFLGVLRTRPPKSFVQWLDEDARLEDGSKFRLHPAQRVPAAKLWDLRVASTVIAWPAGEGKTFLTGLSHAYALSLGMRVGVVFPSEAQAVDYLRTKLKPIIAANVPDAEIVRDVAHSLEYSTGGEIKVRSFRSPGGLRTLEVDVIDCQEIDAAERESTDEGDPIAIALRRVRGSPYSRRFLSSYPDRLGTSNIESFLAESSNCRFGFPCPGCGNWHAWTSADLFFPDGPISARLRCPECDRLIEDAERVELVGTVAEYRDANGDAVTEESEPKAEFGYNEGFWASWVAHAGRIEEAFENYCQQVAAEKQKAEKATDRESAQKVFVNTFDALPYAMKIEEAPDPEDALAQRVEFEPDKRLPEGVAVLTGFVDVNGGESGSSVGHLNLAVLGFGFETVAEKADGTLEFGEPAIYGIHYEEIAGNPRSAVVWEKLDRATRRTWPHPLGFDLVPMRWGVDSGYLPEVVQKFIKPRQTRNFVCCLGARTLGAPPYGGTKILPPYRAKTMTLGADALKSELFAKYRDEGDGGPKPIQFPAVTSAGFDEFFFAGLFESETAEIVRAGRSSFVHYEKIQGPAVPRNEPLDCVCGCLGLRHSIRDSDRALYAGLVDRARLAKKAEGDEES